LKEERELTPIEKDIGVIELIIMFIKKKYLKFNVDRQTPQVPRKHTQNNGCQFERHIQIRGLNMHIIKSNSAYACLIDYDRYIYI
jgi:hypothetical protein